MKKLSLLIALTFVFSLVSIDINTAVSSAATSNKYNNKLRKPAKKKAIRKAVKPKKTSKKLPAQFSFTGRGYGHGVGMTQYGAEGMAEKGYNYKNILKYYYTGVDITKRDTTESAINVALGLNTPLVTISSKSPYSINNGKTHTKLLELPANSSTKIQYKNGSFIINNSVSINVNTTTTSAIVTTEGGINTDTTESSIQVSTTTTSAVTLNPAVTEIEIIAQNGGTIKYKGNSYLGSLNLSRNNTKNNNLDVINILKIENYLRGVIPSEIYPTWKAEAIKAQILASRTYALKQMAIFKNRKFDVYDSELSQVYKGEGVNAARVNTLIDTTAGEVVTYKGTLIDALFSASAGGYTVDASYVWGFNVPYLKGKPDPFDKSAYASNWWTYKINRASLQKLFPKVGSIYKVSISGRKFLRPQAVKITGSKGSLLVRSSTFRNTLKYSNIASAIFSV